jgi:hypothetical protein
MWRGLRAPRTLARAGSDRDVPDRERDEAPETPPDEPDPIPVQDPPPQPDPSGPYVV